jgi:hypothetical protein
MRPGRSGNPLQASYQIEKLHLISHLKLKNVVGILKEMLVKSPSIRLKSILVYLLARCGALLATTILLIFAMSL